MMIGRVTMKHKRTIETGFRIFAHEIFCLPLFECMQLSNIKGLNCSGCVQMINICRINIAQVEVMRKRWDVADMTFLRISISLRGRWKANICSPRLNEVIFFFGKVHTKCCASNRNGFELEQKKKSRVDRLENVELFFLLVSPCFQRHLVGINSHRHKHMHNTFLQSLSPATFHVVMIEFSCFVMHGEKCRSRNLKGNFQWFSFQSKCWKFSVSATFSFATFLMWV